MTNQEAANYPIVAIAGCTGSQKTKLSIKLARETGATVVPLDQLHRYTNLQEGTGLDLKELGQVRSFGYHSLSPWEVSGPEKYVKWLRVALDRLARTGPVIIEGGCTSYLARLVAARSDSLLGRIRILALSAPSSPATRRKQIEARVSPEKMAALIDEVTTLENLGYISEKGLGLLLDCERLWVHPEYQDRSLAWAIRIAAKVYAPAYEALKGRIGIEKARWKIIENVLDIQQYQSTRTLEILKSGAVFGGRDLAEVTDCLLEYLQKLPEESLKSNSHRTALDKILMRRC